MILALLRSTLSALATRQTLVLENLALRQQVAVLQRDSKRPHLRKADRVFWIILSRFWTGWARTLILVKPETVIGWHRNGFHLLVVVEIRAYYQGKYKDNEGNEHKLYAELVHTNLRSPRLLPNGSRLQSGKSMLRERCHRKVFLTTSFTVGSLRS